MQNHLSSDPNRNAYKTLYEYHVAAVSARCSSVPVIHTKDYV